MTTNTSGVLFTENKDGSIRVEVVDYNVEEFGGHDWESWYELTRENAKKLFEELEKIHRGNYREMFVAEFGEAFDTVKFEKFCLERNISFQHMTWS